MTPEEWQRIRPILESALELDPARRSSYLDGACDNSCLRREVESLIHSHEQAGTNALRPGSILCVDPQREARFRLPPGRRIGAYEILEEIALGGMGAVYRAIRADGQYKQQVALKIVRADLGAELTATRFRHERQILASLDHPNIAKIFDGGTTADGLPYFVMELIDGLPITAYCDKNRLTIDERLKIFRTVCSAVHYAHQHLVIHRDIKPGNILVTADGAPKLLDFGIAKILDPGLLPENATMTAGGWLMTPEYASPEQLRGEPITTATDVYSLGLVLYELLTGHRAFQFPSHMPHEVARAILETDPEKPSTVLRRNCVDREDRRQSAELMPERVCSLRSDSLEKLHHRLSGDLDNIVLKAIRKEQRERYSSAEQLSEDIRRHLEHLPVLARKSTVAYRCRKYVLRHKIGVAAAALVFLSLLTGIVLTMREARIAHANQLRAEQRFNDVRKLANSLLFDLHDAIQDLPGSTPARKMIVERALQYLDSLAADATTNAGLARELATAYERVGELQGQPLASNLGETSNSLVSYQKALKLRQQLGDRVNAEWQDRLSLAESYRQMAAILMSVANTQNAFTDIQKAVTITESMSNVRPNDLNVLYELGSDYDVLGGIQGNDESHKKALVVQERILALQPNNISARRARALEAFHIGNVQSDLGHSAEALDSFHDALDAFLSISNAPRDRRRAAAVYNQIAMLFDRMGNQKLSLENHQKGLAIYKHLVSEDPKNALFRQGLAIAYANVGESESDLGRSASGLADINKGLATMKAIVEADPNSDQRDILAQMHISLADAFVRVRRFPEAIRGYRTAIQIRENIHLDGTNVGRVAGIVSCRVRIAEAERLSGNMTAASADFHEAISLSEPHLDEKDDGPRRNAGKAYAGLGDIEASRASTGPEREKQRHWEQSIQWYQRSLEVGKQLPSLGPYDLSNFDAADVARRMRKAESELGKLIPD
jgi:eukaryotic-like serine/threonine-protein kinase